MPTSCAAQCRDRHARYQRDLNSMILYVLIKALCVDVNITLAVGPRLSADGRPVFREVGMSTPRRRALALAAPLIMLSCSWAAAQEFKVGYSAAGLIDDLQIT